MAKVQHHRASPRSVSRIVFHWLKGLPAGELAAQVADWQSDQWQWARTAMHVHGIAPLLYQTLRRLPAWDELPQSIRTYLQNYYELNGERLGILMAELQAILKSARQAGMRVLPLKGAILATHYYQAQALRPMADLDLLVRPSDLYRMGRLLRQLGYRDMLSSLRHQRFLLTRRGLQITSLDREHPDNPYVVEIHTAVEEEFPGCHYRITDDLWNQSEPAQFGDAPGRLVNPPALLEHLLIHGARDLFDHHARLIQLYDMSLVIPHLSAPDWDLLRHEAGRRQAQRWLYAPLRFLERYLGGAAPPDFMAYLTRYVPTRLGNFLEDADLYKLSHLNHNPKTLVDILSWHRPGRERWSAVRDLVMPRRNDPRILRHQTRHRRPLVAYLIYWWQKACQTLSAWLHLPQKSRAHGVADELQER
jgi:hypothetical protein